MRIGNKLRLLYQGFTASFSADNITGDRVFSLPNKDGTFALLDDITGGGGGIARPFNATEIFGTRRVSFGSEPTERSTGDLWFEPNPNVPQPWEWDASLAGGSWESNIVYIDFTPLSLVSSGGSNAANENIFLVKLLPRSPSLLKGVLINSYTSSIRLIYPGGSGSLTPAGNGAEIVTNIWTNAGTKTEIVKFDNTTQAVNTTRLATAALNQYVSNAFYFDFSVKRLGENIYPKQLVFSSTMSLACRYIK